MIKLKIKDEGVMISFSVGRNKDLVLGGKNKEIEISEEVFEVIRPQVEQWEKYVEVENVVGRKESDVIVSQADVQEGGKGSKSSKGKTK